jgi:small GTP-binding protein
MYNSSSSEKTVKRIKTVFLGSSGVGKTCVVQRMIYSTFNTNSSPTIGAAFSLYSVEPNIKIELWDTADQERFNSLLPMYARGAEMVVVIIDIEKNIDEQIMKWNKYIQDNEKLFSPHYKLLLIFNKSDLNPVFEIPTAIMNYTQFIFITFVSAKTGHNIEKLKSQLEQTAKKIVDEYARESHELANARRSGRVINNNNNNNIGDANNNIGMNSNDANDTILGSMFSNMKINVDVVEYREKMKTYYKNSRC